MAQAATSLLLLLPLLLPPLLLALTTAVATTVAASHPTSTVAVDSLPMVPLTLATTVAAPAAATSELVLFALLGLPTDCDIVWRFSAPPIHLPDHFLRIVSAPEVIFWWSSAAARRGSLVAPSS
jgi:hypothetical protein